MGLKGYTEIPPLWQILHVLAPVLVIFGISFYSLYSVVFLQKMCITFYKENFFIFMYKLIQDLPYSNKITESVTKYHINENLNRL